MAKVRANDELQELGFRIRNGVSMTYRKSKIDHPVGGGSDEHRSKAQTKLLLRVKEKARSQLLRLRGSGGA